MDVSNLFRIISETNLDTLSAIASSIIKIVAFFSDLVTVLLGIGAIWGLVFRRRQLSEILRAITRLHITVKVSRLKETLGRLEHMSYDIKENRPTINALMGQLCGQLSPIISLCAALEPIHAEITLFAAHKQRLTEAKKQKLIYEIHGHVDEIHIARDTAV